MAVELEKLEEVLKNKVSEFFGDKLLSLEITPQKELVLTVDRSVILGVCKLLRDDSDFQFDLCSYITAIDYSALGKTPRFSVVYQLTSTVKLHRIRVKVPVPEEDPTVDSVYPVWKVAGFTEREVFDMYGIIFNDHPDLRRILMPDDWEGHPLRKEFPLGGVKSFYFKRSSNPRAGEPEGLVPRIREQLSDI